MNHYRMTQTMMMNGTMMSLNDEFYQLFKFNLF